MDDARGTDEVGIRLLTPSDEAEVAELFVANDRPETTQWFDPFPLTPESAHDLTHHEGRDLYWGIVRDGRIVGIYMVRGWDAGHPHRGMGVFIDHRERGASVGLRAWDLVVDHLRSIGETAVRIRVHEDNERVLHLAVRGGYEEIERGDGRVVFEMRLR